MCGTRALDVIQRTNWAVGKSATVALHAPPAASLRAKKANSDSAPCCTSSSWRAPAAAGAARRGCAGCQTSGFTRNTLARESNNVPDREDQEPINIPKPQPPGLLGFADPHSRRNRMMTVGLIFCWTRSVEWKERCRRDVRGP